MTKNEAYRELKRYRQEVAIAESCRRRLAEIELQMTAIKGTNYDALRVSCGNNGDGLDVLIDKIYEAKTALANAILRSESARKVVEGKIELLEFPYGEILRRRYIDGYSNEKISVRMSDNYKQSYSYQYICNIKHQAVEKYAELIKSSKNY